MIDGISAALEDAGFQVMGMRLDIDLNLGLIAEADVLSCEVESATQPGSIASGGGTGPIAFNHLTCESDSSSSVALVVVPISFPDGMTVTMADGTTFDIEDIREGTTGPQAAAGVIQEEFSPGMLKYYTRPNSDYIECWYVDGDLVCWTPAGGSSGY
ncbi:MAG: hypothetical protein AAFX99_01615 [Myxococcota bacterium]